MKKLLLLLIFPIWVQAQVTGTIQKTPVTGIVRGNFGVNGLDSLLKLVRYNAVLNQVAPADTLSPAVGSAGVLSGTYSYLVTFVTPFGETNGNGGGSRTLVVTSKQINLTNIPISTNPQVTARRIYRNAATGDAVLKKLVTTISNNTATTYTDNIADGSLGAAIPRVNTTGAQIYNGSVRIGVADATSTSWGYNAMVGNTGYANTAFGVSALLANTTGLRNSAFGLSSLQENTTGYENSAFATHSLNNNTTGIQNSAFGYAALQNNTTGGGNSGFGDFNLNGNLTGANNSGFGYLGIRNLTSGNSNSSFGVRNLESLTTGSENAAFGTDALHSVTTTSGNIGLGTGAGYYETGSNKLFIDNQNRSNEADGRVKALIYGVFNADTASQTLKINARFTANKVAVQDGLSTQFMKADGSQDGNTYLTTSSASSTYAPKASPAFTGLLTVSRSANSRQIFIERTTSSAGGAYMGADANGWFVGDASTTSLEVNPSTRVVTITNIGTGAVQATAGVLSVSSDSKIKDLHGKYKGSALQAINSLAVPQYWNYNKKSKLGANAESVHQFGLLADQVHAKLGEEFAPTQGTYDKDGKFIPTLIDGKETYGLSDRALLSLAIQALQEQKEIVERQDARILYLEKQLIK